jgi:putative ABC transport system permease protein
MTSSALWRRSLVALGLAVWSLARHPLRAALTAGGILVGVLSVTTVMTLGEGAERSIESQLQNLGENLLTIVPRESQASGARQTETVTLSELDGQALKSEVAEVSRVAPVVDGASRVRTQARNTSTKLVGTTLDYFAARNYEVSEGALWDEASERAGARVVLLGPTTAEQLFGSRSSVGEFVRIGRHSYRVLGVLAEKGQTPFGMDQDSIAILPLRTMRAKVSPGRPGDVSQLLVQVAKGADATLANRSMTTLLRQRHHLDTDQGDDFSIRDSARIAEAQRAILLVMRSLLLSIAGISLVIGGIGVTNIMLVSVTERSREIGTRLAIGARASDIMGQFLFEAVLLCVLGGITGALCSLLLIPPLEDYFGWELRLSLRALLVATTVSTTLGVTFGLLPARRAAQLDPIEALRRE